MYVFEREVIKVTSGGAVSIVGVEVHDDDTYFASEEVGAEWIVDGVSLGPDGPVLDMGSLGRVFYDGSTDSRTAVHFSDGTNDYYFSFVGQDSNLVSGETGYSASLTPGGIEYAFYGFIPEGSQTYAGDALHVRESGGVVEVVEENAFFLFDDDGTIEFASETGSAPLGVSQHGIRVYPETTDAGAGDTLMVKVTVEYSTSTGTGTMDALKVTRAFGSREYVYYIPEDGHVDLSTITGFVSETILPGSVEGGNWSDFGLTTALIAQTGTSGDDGLEGSQGNDQLKGLDGADFLFGFQGDDVLRGGDKKDILYGGMGQDDIEGGKGADTIYGGLHKDDLKGGKHGDVIYGGAGGDTLNGNTGLDTLEGGRGNDDLVGGDGADSLKGDAGADLLEGGKGDDTLKGGEGGDTLKGGDGIDRLEGGKGADDLTGGVGADVVLGQKGNDTLNGGNGKDTLTGGGGADTFVFSADGKTDKITDFEDGVDLIDLDVGFAALTIVDVVAGEVEITHSGETLIVMDTAGSLVAADLTAADFL